MMRFRAVKKALVGILGTAAAGRFTVTGYEGQGKDAKEVRGNKRNVQILFAQGDFARGARAYGSTNHAMTFIVSLTVSAAAQANIAVLNQVPPAAPAAVSTALEGLREASEVADDSMDELFELVYQILMDGRNIDLGLPEGAVTDRWVGTLKKDGPVPQGSLLVLTGEAHYTCGASEDVIGDIGVAMTDGVTVSLEMPGDEVQVTGITVAGASNLDLWEFNDHSTIQLNDGESLSQGGE